MSPSWNGNKLLVLRRQAYETQKDLKRATGITMSMISRYETGTAVPSTQTLLRIINHYTKKLDVELSLDHFFTDDAACLPGGVSER